MEKILTWLRMNGASILGITQAVIKALKELLTAVVNLISIFIPAISAQKIVEVVRDILNTIDEWVEKIKETLLPEL